LVPKVVTLSGFEPRMEQSSSACIRSFDTQEQTEQVGAYWKDISNKTDASVYE